MLEDLGMWSHNGHDLLLWVGGSSGSRESWVTEMSSDLVLALATSTCPLALLCVLRPA